MDNMHLCLELANSEKEEDVIRILKSMSFWDEHSCWHYFGNLEDNYSTIGNQQSKAEAALVEKIINSVDAVLMVECLERGIDPEGPHAPKSVIEALEKYFKIRNGRLSNLDTKARALLADNICLVATGAKSNPCYSIIDKGEGQTPNSMPKTLLNLFGSIKARIPFVQGKFHMGGTGSFRFCGQHNLQLIISKRKPTITKKEPFNESGECWGFSVIRRENPGNGRRSSVYTYLAPKKEVLRFKADSLPLLPGSYPNKFGNTLEWGTYIKLYEYNMQGLKTNVVFDLYNALSLLLPNIALPIRLYERRKGYGGHTLETTLSGLSVRLDEDKRENLEDGFPSSSTIVCMGQRMTALTYVFKRGQAEKYRRNEGIIFTVNGQTHGHLPDLFFGRTSVGMGYIQDSILVIVDCSEVDGRSKEDLFMNSRDRLCTCPLRSEIEAKLERLIKDHPGLRKLRERRRKEEIEDKLQDSRPLVEVVSRILKNSPTLSKLFAIGGKIPNPFELDEVGVGASFSGRKYPTYFKLINKSKDILAKKCPINWRFRVQFETDAENDYFDRDVDPAVFTLKANGQVISDFVLNLWNGIANLTVSLPEDAMGGDRIKYQSQVKDATRWEPFKDMFEVIVLSEEDHKKGGVSDTTLNGTDMKGKGRHAPSSLSIPNIYEVRRKDWEERKFDEYSALDVISRGEEGYDFYVNMDNICLLTELKYTKSSPELLNARFKYGMVLIGMAMLKEPEVSHTEGGDSDQGELIFGKIRQFTRAISPVLLPMISSLGDLELDSTEVSSAPTY
ncbi:hypothetical protein ES707_20417 [subsurface metagenome]